MIDYIKNLTPNDIIIGTSTTGTSTTGTSTTGTSTAETNWVFMPGSHYPITTFHNKSYTIEVPDKDIIKVYVDGILKTIGVLGMNVDFARAGNKMIISPNVVFEGSHLVIESKSSVYYYAAIESLPTDSNEIELTLINRVDK